ncbi:hypothetical protein [Oricola sp.]|uniref:hypothetical protein n=1 Tax=Oricola sp. TaxID=1979950 RepID=UPI003BA9560D
MASAQLETTTAVETICSQSPIELEDMAVERLADLGILEIDFAIDRDTLRHAGFEHCLCDACAITDFEFLFQLPAFDRIPGQKIAVLSNITDGSVIFAVLNDGGDDIEIVRQDDMPSEIASFANAFMDVFLQLGDLAA